MGKDPRRIQGAGSPNVTNLWAKSQQERAAPRYVSEFINSVNYRFMVIFPSHKLVLSVVPPSVINWCILPHENSRFIYHKPLKLELCSPTEREDVSTTFSLDISTTPVVCPVTQLTTYPQATNQLISTYPVITQLTTYPQIS